MAANIAQLAIDAALDYLISNAARIDICSAEPTTYTQATSTNTLGNATNGAGFTAPLLGAKATNGNVRQVPTAAIASAPVTGTGTATWAGITKTTATTDLLVVMDMTDQAVTQNNTWSAASVNIGIPRQ
jgi:hypothetical protein